jgi:hypothetical protein
MKAFFTTTAGVRAGISIGLILLSGVILLVGLATGTLGLDALRSMGTVFTVLVIHLSGLLVLMGSVTKSISQPRSHKQVLSVLMIFHVLCLVAYLLITL